jgi:hypothetical protein
MAGCWSALTSLGRGLGNPCSLAKFQQRFAQDRQATGEASNAIEAQFATTGDALEKLSDLTGNLVKEAENVFEIALGKADSGTLQSPGANLLEWLNSLDETRQQLPPLLSGIGSHQRRIERLMNHEKRLGHAVSTLQILPSLFKIESASLSADNRRLFLGLVQDIHNVHEKVSDSLRTSFETVQLMGRRLAEGRTQFNQFIETKCRSIGIRRAELEGSILENTRQLEANQSENVNLLETTREAQQQVGRVVIALQYQDITKQKLDHIDRMRSEIEGTLSKRRLTRADLQFCREGVTLCRAHGDSVTHDLDQACSEIQCGVGEIARLGQIDETCLTLQQFNALAISADGFIQKMLDASDELDMLTRDLVQGVRDLVDFLEPLSGALSGLSLTMNQVSAEIRLIALNAQVQAIQNGLGTGLEILSARTCDVADDMFAIGQEMTLSLQEMESALGNDLDFCRTVCAAGEDLLEKLETRGQNDAEGLHAYRDRALNMLVAVSDIGSEIAQRARQVVASCSFDKLGKAALAQANRTLHELARELEIATGRGRAPLPPGHTVETFRRYYSTADEVESHNRLFGSPEPPADARQASLTETNDDGFLFAGAPGTDVNRATAPSATTQTAPVVAAAVAATPSLAGVANDRDGIEMF